MTTGTLNPTRFLQYENRRLQDENDTLRSELEKLHRVFEALMTLQEMSVSVTAQTDVLQLLDRLLESALGSVGAKDGSLLLADEEKNELAFVVVHGEVREKLMGHRISIGTGIAGWVAQKRQAVVISNARLDPRFSPEVDHSFHFHTRSMLCVPVVYAGKVLGVIQALNKEDGAEFNRADLSVLGVVAQLVGESLHRAETAVSE